MRVSQDDPDLPIRLAGPTDPGIPFSTWLDRRTRGNRRQKERQMAFIQQWDRLRDEMQAEPTAEAYAERWRTSHATAYRLLAEFRSLMPGQVNPTRLLTLLWRGLSAPHVPTGTVGALLEVEVTRQMRDMRDLLPPITHGRLRDPVLDRQGRKVVAAGAQYDAYELNADRFAWAGVIDGYADETWKFASFLLEGDADEIWIPAGSPKGHPTRDYAELESAARWATSIGHKVTKVGVRIATPVFRQAPGARPSRREME